MSDKLIDSAEVLFRQVHPELIQDGNPASSGFRPKVSDENLLSVDRSALTSAEAAHALYTMSGRLSAAVYGISVAEFDTQNVSCRGNPTSKTEAAEENPAHAVADFTAHGSSKQKTIGQKLKKAALARGLLYPDASAVSE